VASSGVLWVSAALLIPVGCSSESSSGGPATDASSTFTAYRGAGCLYDVAPPERHGCVDLSLHDATNPGAEPVRLRLGLGGETTSGTPGYADPSRTAVVTWET